MNNRAVALIVLFAVLLAPLALAQTPAERITTYAKEWAAFASDFNKYIDWLKTNGYNIGSELGAWKEIQDLVDKAQKAVAEQRYTDAKAYLRDADAKFATFAERLMSIVREEDLEGVFEDLEKWIGTVDQWLVDLGKTGYDLSKIKPEWERIRDQFRLAQDQFSKGDDETAWATIERANKDYAKWEAKLEKELNAQNNDWIEWCAAVGVWSNDLKEWIEATRAPAQAAKEQGYTGAAEYVRMIETEFDPTHKIAAKALEDGDCGWAAENLQELESWREFLNGAGNEWWNNLVKTLTEWETWMAAKSEEIEQLRSSAAEHGIELDFSGVDSLYNIIRDNLNMVYAVLEDQKLQGWGADDWLAAADQHWIELDWLIQSLKEELEMAKKAMAVMPEPEPTPEPTPMPHPNATTSPNATGGSNTGSNASGNSTGGAA